MSVKNKFIYINISLPNIGFVPAGVITFNDDNFSAFSYFPSYIEKDYPSLNPSTLNWKTTGERHFITASNNNQRLDRTFWELLPNQNDWGNQVLISKYPEYASMNNLQKLYFLRQRTVGGLSSYVKEEGVEENIDSLDWLERTRSESVDFYLNNIEKISSIKAINPMTSYGGMRPKCMFEDDNGDFWVAKFNLPTDPYNMARVEQTALDASREIGLKTSESKVITLSSGEDVFLSKRFDINKEERYHSLSFFALLKGNEKQERIKGVPGNSGLLVFDLIKNYSDFANTNTIDLLNKFLLDMMVNNTDNHLRNLRLILNKDLKWELAPIYDVISNHFSHAFTYNPFDLPLSDLYLNNEMLIDVIAQKTGISDSIVEDRVTAAKKVAENWYERCKNNGLSFDDTLKVGNAMHLGVYRQELERKNLLEIMLKQKSQLKYDKLKPKM